MKNRRGNNLMALFADAVFHPGDPRFGGAPVSAPLAGLPRLWRLEKSGQEARAILALAKGRGRLFTGFDARRDYVLNGELESYEILHFAIHGVLRDDRPELSALIFSRFDASGRPFEHGGQLSLSEIHDLSISAALVVLSACQSAVGQEIRGEGLMGLSRGFLYAGATRVLASLWKVHDESTAELMSRFYRHLLVEGKPAPAALRSAQRSMLAEPGYDLYHWAGFVLQGDWL